MFWENENLIVVIAGTIMLLLLGIFIISFLFFYQKKHNVHKQEQELLQSAFRQELLKTQIEVQEQTLTNISREIHDNVTQVLSFVKLNLGMIGQESDTIKKKIDESRELVAQTINDLRNLSKSLSFEHIAELGLVKTIEIETDRINNSGLLKTILTINDDSYPLGEHRELVLFRIFQEALNNTLKHANAKHLKISLQYSEHLFNLILEDDGNGFLPGELNLSGGLGLKNMQSRATLIGAVATIDSEPGKGCCIKIMLNPLNTYIYSDANYPNSPG